MATIYEKRRGNRSREVSPSPTREEDRSRRRESRHSPPQKGRSTVSRRDESLEEKSENKRGSLPADGGMDDRRRRSSSPVNRESQENSRKRRMPPSTERGSEKRRRSSSPSPPSKSSEDEDGGQDEPDRRSGEYTFGAVTNLWTKPKRYPRTRYQIGPRHFCKVDDIRVKKSKNNPNPFTFEGLEFVTLKSSPEKKDHVTNIPSHCIPGLFEALGNMLQAA